MWVENSLPFIATGSCEFPGGCREAPRGGESTRTTAKRSVALSGGPRHGVPGRPPGNARCYPPSGAWRCPIPTFFPSDPLSRFAWIPAILHGSGLWLELGNGSRRRRPLVDGAEGGESR